MNSAVPVIVSLADHTAMSSAAGEPLIFTSPPPLLLLSQLLYVMFAHSMSRFTFVQLVEFTYIVLSSVLDSLIFTVTDTVCPVATSMVL